jgi:hypothetical protein
MEQLMMLAARYFVTGSMILKKGAFKGIVTTTFV